MSCACGLNDIGSNFLKTGLPSNNSAAMSGVREDVAQVSKTSFSGSNSEEPHLHLVFGLSTKGSTGSCFSSAIAISLHLLQYHAGIGTPKCLCLEMFQSHFRPSIQFSYLTLICPGCHFILLPYFMKSLFRSRYFMNHWSVLRISISVSHLSCTLTTCLIGSIFSILFSSFNASTTAFLAFFTCIPANFPAFSFKVPFLFIISIGFILNSSIHLTSSISP